MPPETSPACGALIHRLHTTFPQPSLLPLDSEKLRFQCLARADCRKNSIRSVPPFSFLRIQSQAPKNTAHSRKLFKSTLNNRLHRNLDCVIDKSSRGAKLKRAFEELPRRASFAAIPHGQTTFSKPITRRPLGLASTRSIGSPFPVPRPSGSPHHSP